MVSAVDASERVLIYPGVARAAEEALRSRGVHAETVDSFDALCTTLPGAALVIIGAEQLTAAASEQLRSSLDAQPPAADPAFLVLVGKQADQGALWVRLAQLPRLGPAALLDRDVPEAALADAVELSLRGRRRRNAREARNGRGPAETVSRPVLIRLLHDVASAANRARTLDDALAQVLPQVTRQLGWSCGQAFVPAEQDPERLVISSAYYESEPGRFAAFREASRAVSFSRGQGLPGRVYATGRAEWLDNLQELLPERAGAAARLGIRAVIACPVLAGRETVAVLEFLTERPLVPDGRAREVLASIGTQLGRVVERERAERLLRQSERLTALGTFAAGIAHEVNNPLASILMTARYGLRGERTVDELRGLLAEIVEDGERCARIVRNVLRFARQESGQKGEVVLNELVQRVAHVLRGAAEQRGVRLELHLADALPPTWACSLELEQALVHLVSNAVQVSPAGQSVRIETLAAERGVAVRIRDTGPGMSGPEAERAFEPFYTTHTRENRSGLGLSLAHGIVADHGGAIQLQTQPGRGTTLLVELPSQGAKKVRA